MPCHFNHDPPEPDACHLCRVLPLYAHRWEGAPGPTGPATGCRSPRGRCGHLGAEPVGLRECKSCGGRVRLKTFRCALGLGEGGAAVPSRDCGRRCPGYAPVDSQAPGRMC